MQNSICVWIKSAPLTAEEIVNEWSYDELVRIFYRYGEEKFSKQIARNIERIRAQQRIETTGELVDIIRDSIPAAARRKGGHPAKRIFQAIRIAVNDELAAIEDSLEQAFEVVGVGGRISCDFIPFFWKTALSKQCSNSKAQ